MLAAALLTVISFHNLFAGTVLGFLVSAALVVSVRLPTTIPGPRRGIWDRTTRGTCIYLATPRLRGLLAISLAVSAAGAMVIVNTVVLVKARFGLGAIGLAQVEVQRVEFELRATLGAGAKALSRRFDIRDAHVHLDRRCARDGVDAFRTQDGHDGPLRETHPVFALAHVHVGGRVTSAAAHATVSGNIHFVAEDESGALALSQRLLSFLPANNVMDPPHRPVSCRAAL